MAKADPKSHTVTFWVDDDGFHYRDQGGSHARRKHVNRSDSIAWRHKGNKDFTILFADTWPFDPPSEPISGGGGATAPRVVTRSASGAPVECKYTVTLSSGLSDDPEIIIDPEEP